MECNHDAAPALDSLLFLTDPLPKSTDKSTDNFDGKYPFRCQKQVYGTTEEEEEKCGRQIWSFPHVKRKKCTRCRGREDYSQWEHKEFIREIDGLPIGIQPIHVRGAVQRNRQLYQYSHLSLSDGFSQEPDARRGTPL